MKTVISISEARKRLPGIIKALRSAPDTVYQVTVHDEVVAEIRTSPLVKPGAVAAKADKRGVSESRGGCIMKQITIRNIPEEVKKAIQKESLSKGVSLNKAVISLLERAVVTNTPEKKKRVAYHDLDHLAGIWSKEEAKEFRNNIRMFETIDEDIWR